MMHSILSLFFAHAYRAGVRDFSGSMGDILAAAALQVVIERSRCGTSHEAS